MQPVIKDGYDRIENSASVKEKDEAMTRSYNQVKNVTFAVGLEIEILTFAAYSLTLIILPRDAMLARYMLSSCVRPSVHLTSVRPSQASTASK